MEENKLLGPTLVLCALMFLFLIYSFCPQNYDCLGGWELIDGVCK